MVRRSSEQILDNWIRELKNLWQILIIGAFVLYGIGLYKFFSNQPTIRKSVLPYFQILDIGSLIIALGLTAAIYLIKKKYFSLRTFRILIKDFMSTTSEQSGDRVLPQVLQVLRSKFILVWILGFLVILDGVIFFLVTLSGNNMHIYFIVGLFSLFLNYPRKELVVDIPFLLEEVRRELSDRQNS